MIRRARLVTIAGPGGAGKTRLALQAAAEAVSEEFPDGAWLTDLSRTPAHARAETLAEQPMFREAFRLRRGLVPVNGFYEWRGVRKRPYWVGAEGGLLYCAALWEVYPAGDREYLSLALVTRPAADLRRPLLLDAEGQRDWLAAETPAARLTALLQAPVPPLRERALAGLVNDPNLDGPECLTPA